MSQQRQQGQQQQHLSTASAPSSTKYVSPYAEYFSMIQRNNQNHLSLTGTAPPPAEEEKITSQITNTSPTLKCGIPENILKFKTTSYPRLMLPPYTQPADYKVTLQVNYKDLPLTSKLEYQIFLQIVGKRFDEDRKSLKLTSNHFASRIENKRHLCSMLDRIVIGVQRLAREMNSNDTGTSES